MKKVSVIIALAFGTFLSVSLASSKKTAQCQAQSSQFQCPLQALPGSDYCTYHQDWNNGLGAKK
jgi:hypothetical protein